MLTKLEYVYIELEFNNVELQICFGGVPNFDGVNVNYHIWKPILKAMQTGTCKVRYQYLYRSPSFEQITG